MMMMTLVHFSVSAERKILLHSLGVANGTSKNVGLGKFQQDLEISEVFLLSLKVSFLYGLFLLFLSLKTFNQRVSGSASLRVSDFTIRHPYSFCR